MTSWKESRKKFKNLEISMVYIAFFELFVITCSLHGTRAVAGKFSTFLWLHTGPKHLRRAGPPGRDTHLTRPASPALRPPLRAHAWQTNTNTADRSPGVGRAHASSVRPLGRCTHRACDSILTPRSRSASVRDVCDGAYACDALRVTVS